MYHVRLPSACVPVAGATNTRAVVIRKVDSFPFQPVKKLLFRAGFQLCTHVACRTTTAAEVGELFTCEVSVGRKLLQYDFIGSCEECALHPDTFFLLWELF